VSASDSAVLPAPIHERLSFDVATHAREHGLQPVGARPRFGEYLRELWRTRHFLKAMSSAQVLSANSDSRLGAFWELLNPILQAVVFYIAFGVLLNGRAGIDNFEVFLLVGVFGWHTLSASVTQGANAIPNNRGLTKSLHFPRAVLPLTIVARQAFTLGPKMGVLLVVMLLTHEPITWKIFQAIPAWGLLLTFSAGAALLLARVTANNPDVSNVLPFCMRMWLYLSGVFFDIGQRLANQPEWLQYIATHQPGAVLLALVRSPFLEQYPAATWQWVLGSVWAIGLLIVGGVVFWWGEEKYGDV
jgi:teichoic acid transport system permease protein